MGNPGGGRTFISQRIIRHFNIFGYTELNQDTIKYMFNTLVGHFLKRYTPEIKDAIPNIVDCVMNVY